MEYAIAVVTSVVAMAGVNELYQKGKLSRRTARALHAVGLTVIASCFVLGAHC
jgi:hypothetical protein